MIGVSCSGHARQRGSRLRKCRLCAGSPTSVGNCFTGNRVRSTEPVGPHALLGQIPAPAPPADRGTTVRKEPTVLGVSIPIRVVWRFGRAPAAPISQTVDCK